MKTFVAPAACAVLCVLGGCWSTHEGSALPRPVPGDARALEAGDWPERPTERLVGLRDSLEALRDSSDEAESSVAADLRFNELVGESPTGLLRVYDETDPDESDIDALFADLVHGFHPNAYFLTDREVRGIPRLVGKDLEEDGVRARDGVGIRLPGPASGGMRPRGVILRLTALMVTSYEDDAVSVLEDAGWAVVSIDTQTALRPPVIGRELPLDITYAELARKRSRTNERYELDIAIREQTEREPLGPDEWARQVVAGEVWQVRGFLITPETDLGELGAEIAGHIDDTLAENAFAAEAVLDYIDAERPDLSGLPVVVLGFSAGALAAPTVAARLGDRIDGLVLVGGGADVFGVGAHSDLIGNGMHLYVSDEPIDPETGVVDRERRVSNAVRDELNELVLERTRLDPYHMAPLLSSLPVLVVDGSFDVIVPSANAALLRERLGSPDRVRYLGGHMGLFYFLAGEMGRVTRWLDENVPASGIAR